MLNTLILCKLLKLHSTRQILLITISKIHATTICVAENAAPSLQLPEPSHMPQFLQQSHTANKMDLEDECLSGYRHYRDIKLKLPI